MSENATADQNADLASVLWALSPTAERQALLSEVAAISPNDVPAGFVDTSRIFDPQLRAQSDAFGGYLKHDPTTNTNIDATWVFVASDLDGGNIFRTLTDYDIYGPGVNHAYAPMSHNEFLAQLAPLSAFVALEDLARIADDAAAREAAAIDLGRLQWLGAAVPSWADWADRPLSVATHAGLLLAAAKPYYGPTFGERATLGGPTLFHLQGRILSGRTGGFEVALGDLDRIARTNGIPELGSGLIQHQKATMAASSTEAR